VSAARKIFLIGFLTCCAARGAAHLDAADDKTLELGACTKAISEERHRRRPAQSGHRHSVKDA